MIFHFLHLSAKKETERTSSSGFEVQLFPALQVLGAFGGTAASVFAGKSSLKMDAADRFELWTGCLEDP